MHIFNVKYRKYLNTKSHTKNIDHATLPAVRPSLLSWFGMGGEGKSNK